MSRAPITPFKGYAPNSLESQRFKVVPWQRLPIQLVGDRSQGALIPQVEGESIYIEAVDYPCRLMLVTGDGLQALNCRDGLMISAPVKEMTLFHDNIAQVGAGLQQPQLVLLMSHDPDAVSNQLAAPTSRIPVPYNVGALTPGANGNLTFTFPVPVGSRRITRLKCLVHGTTAALALDLFRGTLQFLINSGTNIQPAITSSAPTPVTYATIPSTLVVMPDRFGAGGAGFTFQVYFNIEDLPIPSWANTGSFQINSDANNNWATVDINTLELWFE